MRRWESEDTTQAVGQDSSPAADVHVGLFVPAKSGAWRPRADLEVCPTSVTNDYPSCARLVGAADRGRSRRSHPGLPGISGRPAGFGGGAFESGPPPAPVS